MKALEPIKVGKYRMAAFANHDRENVIEVTVLCGEENLTRKLTHQGDHDHSEEQFEKDVNTFAERLAHELAGTLRSRELAKKFTSAGS